MTYSSDSWHIGAAPRGDAGGSCMVLHVAHLEAPNTRQGRAMTTLTEALRQRVSVRAFLPDLVSSEIVRDILDVARWAPSGGNLQPWKVIVVAGRERDAVVELVHEVRGRGGSNEAGSYPVYPPQLWEPYRSRRYQLGEAMYALLRIPRSDRVRRLARWEVNYDFFGAPVGMFFIIDERMEHAQWAHMGMFMQSIALAALERGLGTCMQEAWSAVRETLKGYFALPATEMVYCGLALGYADRSAAVNELRSERVEVEQFATLRGFE